MIVNRKSLLAGTILAGLSVLVLAPQAAWAADDGATTATDQSTASDVDELVVTGSRIPRAGFDTMQPASVVSDQTLEERSFSNVAQALNQLPTFGLPGASNVGDQSGSNVGENFVNFFGLGSQRTLTLVNGRRFVSSNPPTLFGDAAAGLQVDLNDIPIGLVDRVEVVAVGGAPIYGADAIAGTVNIILKHNFQGLEASGTYGVSEKGDGQTYQGRLLVGGNFADNRGNAVVSVEYDKDSSLTYLDRPFTANGGTFQADAACAARGFGRCYYTQARVASISYGGVPIPDDFIANLDPIVNGAGQPVAFAPNGNLVPFNFGTPHGAVFSSGGDGVDLNGLTSLQAPIQRILVNGLAHYDLTPHVQAYVETFFANGRAVEQVNQPAYQSLFFGGTSGNLEFTTDNPFLTPQAKGILDANTPVSPDGLHHFFLARANLDLFPDTQSNEVNVYRGVFGVKGDFTVSDRKVNWDVSYNYGRSRGDARSFDIYDQAFFNAIDVVTNPATGQPACRVTVTPPPPLPNGRVDPTVANCVPLDLFGEGAPSAAAKAFVTAPVSSISILTEQDFSAFFNTELFQLPAGPFSVAGGFEYRKETGSFQVDPFTMNGLGRQAAISDLAGQFDSKEAYIETVVPILKPGMVSWAYSAEFEGSYRRIDNSRAGADDVYTLGGKFRPLQDIEFRGNYTRSVRAPAITELFLPLSTTFSFADDPCDPQFITKNATRQANCAADFANKTVSLANFSSNVIGATATGTAGGNPNLLNETAKSWTVGAVIRPHWVPGLTMAIDYVNILLVNPITQLTLTQVMDGCYDSHDFPNNQLCHDFARDSAGQVTGFSTPTTNVGSQAFSGVTFDASYGSPVNALPLVHTSRDLGSVDVSLNALWLRQHYLNILGTDDSIQHLKGGFTAPTFRAQSTVGWTYGRLRAALETRYISGVAFDPDATSAAQDISTVGNYWLFNVNVSYKVTPSITAQLNVDNLFDRQPPRYSDAAISSVALYDVIGRYFTFTIRSKF